jgi:hypothetical protein
MKLEGFNHDGCCHPIAFSSRESIACYSLCLRQLPKRQQRWNSATFKLFEATGFLQETTTTTTLRLNQQRQPPFGGQKRQREYKPNMAIT